MDVRGAVPPQGHGRLLQEAREAGPAACPPVHDPQEEGTARGQVRGDASHQRLLDGLWEVVQHVREDNHIGRGPGVPENVPLLHAAGGFRSEQPLRERHLARIPFDPVRQVSALPLLQDEAQQA